MTDIPDTTQPPAAAAGAAAAQPTKSWTANALVAALTAFVTVTVGALGAMLVYEFNSIDDKFAAVDDKFAAVNERFDDLDQKVDDLALQLAVLIAALNKTDEVGAAVAGEVTATVSSAASIPPP